MANVSVVMPAYNRMKLIERSVRSVQAQTFRDWQLLVVDDGSTDDTVGVVQSLADNDNRITCIRNSRSKGPAGARNCGLDHAQTKYIAYLDSDDEWESFHLGQMVEYLDKYPDVIDIMTANPLRKYQESGEVFNYDELDLSIFQFQRIADGYLFAPETVFERQLFGRVLTTQAIVGRSEVIKSTAWNESIAAGDDCLYNLELCRRRPRICHLQAYHVIYWAHEDSLTNCAGSKSPRQLESLATDFAEYLRLVNKFDLTPSQRKKVCRDLSGVLAWQLGYSALEPQGKHRQARQCYREAIRLTPGTWRLWKAYGMSWIKQLARRGVAVNGK